MNFNSYQEVIAKAGARSKVSDATLKTYVKESIRALKEAYKREELDFTAFQDMKPFAVWLSTVPVRRRHNFANSTFRVLEYLGAGDALLKAYEKLRDATRVDTADDKELATTEKTDRQKEQWVSWESVKGAFADMRTEFGNLNQKGAKHRTRFLNMMIGSWYSNDSFVLRPTELRTMRMVDDGESNFYDRQNDRLVIRKHKNEAKTGKRIVSPIPGDVKTYTDLFHQRYPGKSHVIPTTRDGQYDEARFKNLVKSVLGATPQIIRSVFVSEYVSTLPMKRRSEISKKMGHRLSTQVMLYDKSLANGDEDEDEGEE